MPLPGKPHPDGRLTNIAYLAEQMYPPEYWKALDAKFDDLFNKPKKRKVVSTKPKPIK